MTEKRPRAYVCGPMAGKPGLNADQFEKARCLVEQRGHEAVDEQRGDKALGEQAEAADAATEERVEREAPRDDEDERQEH